MAKVWEVPSPKIDPKYLKITLPCLIIVLSSTSSYTRGELQGVCKRFFSGLRITTTLFKNGSFFGVLETSIESFDRSLLFSIYKNCENLLEEN